MKKRTKRKDEKLEKKPVERKIRPEEKLYEFKVHKPLPLMEYLMLKLPSLGRNKIKSILAHYQVLVDGMPVTRFDFELASEDVVTVLKYGKKEKGKGKEPFDLPIIYEDDDFIVINKPSGLLSIASDKEREKTAYRMLNNYVRQKDPKSRIFILHRIDKDTSGVLVVCKNVKIRDALQKHWNERVMDRGYYAIVESAMDQPKGTFHTWLIENSTNLMFSSHKKGEGQEAITHYEVMEDNGTYSLLDVHIDTGRKNQIRVHLKEVGHPIIGDDKYGNGVNPLKRLGLHAYLLAFEHPFTKKKMVFKAPIPKEFLELIHTKKKK